MEYESVLPGGYRIEEYEIVRVLGAGGFGITYLGRDHHLDKPVAIKEYLPNDLAVRKGDTGVVARSSGDRDDFNWGLERFLEEARVLARFDHPNLPKVYRFFTAHGTAYIVMEYIEGTSLIDVFKRKGPFREDTLKPIILPLLDGLELVHETGYLHRDIKPANIIVRNDGAPVLLDFGAARAAVGVKSRSLTSILTPGYAPIEQYSARGNQGPWTDLYAIGAVMYQGLTGAVPPVVTDRIREDPMRPAVEIARGRASRSFLQAIDYALKVEETERPRSVQDWRRTLERQTPETEVLQQPQTGASNPKAQPWRVPALILVGMVVVGGGLWLGQDAFDAQSVESARSRAGADTGLEASPEPETRQETTLTDSRIEERKETGYSGDKNSAINTLLEQCQSYVDGDHLMTGETGNALECYRNVLELDAGNAVALAFIEKTYRAEGLSEYSGRVQTHVRVEETLDNGKVMEGTATVTAGGRLEIAGENIQLHGITEIEDRLRTDMQRFIDEQGPHVNCNQVTDTTYHCETDSGVDLAAAALINGATTASGDASEKYRSYERDAKENYRGIWEKTDE